MLRKAISLCNMYIFISIRVLFYKNTDIISRNNLLTNFRNVLKYENYANIGEKLQKITSFSIHSVSFEV